MGWSPQFIFTLELAEESWKEFLGLCVRDMSTRKENNIVLFPRQRGVC